MSAFRRGSEWKPIDAYRLRQIPEMGLATAALALITIPLGDTTHNPIVTVQVVSGVALLFTVAHIVVLLIRARERGIALPSASVGAASTIDIIVIVAGAASLALGSTTNFEWLLVALVARPMLAFVLVLTELPTA